MICPSSRKFEQRRRQRSYLQPRLNQWEEGSVVMTDGLNSAIIEQQFTFGLSVGNPMLTFLQNGGVSIEPSPESSADINRAGTLFAPRCDGGHAQRVDLFHRLSLVFIPPLLAPSTFASIRHHRVIDAFTHERRRLSKASGRPS